jgi:hypothetical protein
MSDSLDQPQPPIEDVNRGTVLALIVVPVGITAWVLLWSLGFIASIVSFGVAYLAVFLYQRGSGGTVGRAGAVRITVITLATVLLAIVAGIVSDVALAISRVAGISPIEALSTPQFGTIFNAYLSDSESVSALAPSVLIAIAFGVLGCFGILRNAFRATAQPASAAPQVWPSQPPAAEFHPESVNPEVPPATENPSQR